MESPVYVKSYAPPKYNKSEILRYTGVKGEDLQILELIDECLSEIEGKLNYKVCYMELPVKVLGDTVDLYFTSVKSKNLAKNLNGSIRYVLFAATIGIEIDRCIARYSRVSPVKALIFQAIGAERIESLCDLFNKEIAEKHQGTKPRFSPGYGDFSIEVQREIFNVLDCSKKIGLSLNASLLMSPSKSVTAIIGISDSEAKKEKKSCNGCGKIDCEFRRE